MQCGLCHQQVGHLVKSHIVPLAMLLHGKPVDSEEGMIILPSSTGRYVKRSPNGVWDRIVCDACEKSFKEGDDALIALLRSLDRGMVTLDDQGKPMTKMFQHVNTVAIHRGIVTTLFRAHLSAHETQKRVKLGKFAESLRALLLASGSTLHEGFDVILRVVDSVQASIVQSPFLEKMFEVNTYRLYFPHIVATIKVHQRPFPKKYDDLVMRENSPLTVINHEDLALPEQRMLTKLFTLHRPKIDRIRGTNR